MEHESFIRECHSLAINAGKKGNQPFGAVLVHEGRIIMKAENTVETDKDTMRHAEYNLVLLSKQALSKDIMEHSILYTSTAPCILCTASILTMNIPKIVYSVSNETFGKLIPGVYRYISCEKVITRLGRNIEARARIR
jgi:tRNA(Arg) A34 adenosine deaminase TadA